MRGDAAEHPAGDHALHQSDVIGIDLGLGRKRNTRWLLVRPLAQTDADTLREQPRRILLRPAQVGLQHRTHGPGRLPVQLLGECERGLGVGRALHVDAHKAPCPRGMADHLADEPLGQRRIHLHAHLGQLHTHIGAQLSLCNLLEQLMVDRSAGLGLGYLGHALTQRVERDLAALLIQPCRRGDRFLHRHSRNESPRDALPQRRAFGEAAEAPVRRQPDEEGTQHTVPRVCHHVSDPKLDVKNV